MEAQTAGQMVETTLDFTHRGRWMLLAQVIKDRNGEHVQLFDQLRSQGHPRIRVNGNLIDPNEEDPPKLAMRQKHTIEAVADRFALPQDDEDFRQRLTEKLRGGAAFGIG